MALVYHGTTLNNGLKIAETGVIFSPWFQEIKRFQELYFENRGCFAKLYPNQTIKQVALKFASSLYSEYELEHRVKSVSLTSDLSVARTYATGHEDYYGGLILGIQMSETEISKIREGTCTIFYQPEQLFIENLTEVHISEEAHQYMNLIREAFQSFDPTYKQIF